MRLVELARVAATAEALRWRLMMRRQVMRVVMMVVAAFFLLFMLSMLEYAAVAALEPSVGLVYALLLVALANLLVAGLLLILAARGAPSHAEDEALEVRRTAVASMRSAGLMMAVLRGGWSLARRSRRR